MNSTYTIEPDNFLLRWGKAQGVDVVIANDINDQIQGLDFLVFDCFACDAAWWGATDEKRFSLMVEKYDVLVNEHGLSRSQILDQYMRCSGIIGHAWWSVLERGAAPEMAFLKARANACVL